MSVLVSRAFVDFDRSWDNFARKQGCLETWTFEGRLEAMVRRISSEAMGELRQGSEDRIETMVDDEIT